MGPIAVFVTAPSAEKAVAIGRTLVEERLAACVNIVPGLRSIYRWEGQVQDEPEVLLVIKTERSRFEALRARVVALHDYSCPEVIALEIATGHTPYLDWIRDSVAGPGPVTSS